MRRTAGALLGLTMMASPAFSQVIVNDPSIVGDICNVCTQFTLYGNASIQAAGGRNFIDFAPVNQTNPTPGSTLAEFGGLQFSSPYLIEIVGQNTGNSAFIFTLNTTTGLGTFALGGFASGAVDQVFAFTTDATGAGTLRIDATGGNFVGKIDRIGIVAVPGPVAGAGLPALGLLGLAWWRRRKAQGGPGRA